MNTTVIEAGEGKFLTQVSKSINIRARVVAKRIAIGKNDSPDNWHEISEEEAMEFERQLNQAIQDDLALMPE